ncbi:hypothetical protein EDC04DRAFT_2605399 [Pisolithus marmoratus]|nr:hypothetical protein EDC04DRAFT_2605399 [Pisolithus marmoratus]
MSSPALEDDDTPQSFSIFLTVYSKIKKMSVRGRTTLKEEKSTKMKELLFITVNSNYLDFLQAILLKHGLENYEVTEKRHFPLKYVPPKVKGQWVTDAINVNNAIDYREMVKKISEDKPSVVKIFVDMQHIEKLPQAVKSSDDSEFASDSSKLQKAYKNEHDKGLTYIGPLGSIPLMPTMVQDWCLELEDGQATITTLLNIELFNMANKAPILHLMCKAAVQPAAPTAVDLNSLTSAILLWTLAQFDSGLHSLALPVTPTPQNPDHHQVRDVDSRSSPPIPSPSKLSCYLQFAETHLSVQHTLTYKSALELHRISPDIILDVSDKLLADLGLSAGDAICLKKGSITWWNGPNAK